MRRWEKALARKLPRPMRWMFVVPCACCGEPARWKLPLLLLLPLRLFLSPLRLLFRFEMIVVLAVGGIFCAFGSPHVGWDYVCRHSKMYSARCLSYEYCAYYGLHGRRVVFPEPGETCWLVKLLPAPSTS